MPSTMITLAARMPMDEAEQLVRRHFERDGAVTVAAPRKYERRCRQLRQLAKRLSADPAMEVSWGDGEGPDGGHRYILVTAPGTDWTATWGYGSPVG